MMNIAGFDKLRPTLEKQYENAVFSSEDCWSEEQIREAWNAHKCKHTNEERILSRAFLTSLILEHAPIAIEPFNPFLGKFQHFNLLAEDLKEGYRLAGEKVPGVICNGTDYDLGINWQVDRSHVAPDWKNLLRLGLPGLIARAEKGTSPFHKSVVMVYKALAEFCRRVARLNNNPVYDEIASHAPQTLYEAFALAYVLHDAIEFASEEVRSMGRFDEIYIDFYRNDLAAGRLTRDSAKELIKFFWIAFYARYQGTRFGKNFCFGPNFNELSYIGMEAYYELNIVDPKLSVLVQNNMPQDFAELYARCIRDGRTGIVSLNYDVIVEGLIRHGRTPEDAANFIPIGCYEPAVAGKEVSCSGTSHIILPIPVLSVLRSGIEYSTFEDFKDAYLEQLRKICVVMGERQTLCDLAWKYVNPVPLLSGTFDSCLEKGRDISDAGAFYNTTGCVVSYLADAVDSLAAIRYLVYEQKLCTLSELSQILNDNWQGHEKLRGIVLHRAAKWGNNDPRVDELAVEISTFISKCLFSLPNGRGGFFFPAIFGQLVVERGKNVGALPSGRLAGEPMSKNMCAAIGMDRNGITALMDSVLKVDMRQFPNGTCLDIMLHPTSVSGDDGPKILVSLIRTFIAHGGSGIQFNIFDAAILRDAQVHPEQYANLQVRVCGWNVRFTDLAPEAQDTFIRQAEAIA
ncbi:MAG: hypothetical protein K6G44_11835 [Lentisphaeria bacterium]|nr:hypothetical protein [Lentisphaeria bacterium]